jgi:alpha-D-xyloside xylohydrolase
VEVEDPEHDAYEANGWFVDIPILFNQFGPLVDLTNPDAAAAWTGRIDAAHARGVEGWKLDYGEDVQLGLYETRLVTSFHNGQDERTMHHAFAKDYHRVYAGEQGEKFLLGRAGVLGGHTITDAIWPGDLDSDFRHHREDGHVGGLPAAIRGGTGLAASGYPFYASDTGGYRHERPTEEVMLRWTEYAALLPIFQYGGSGKDHNPWNFEPDGESVFTAFTLETFRRYAVLHTQLFPYFRLLSERVATTGLPIVMAQGFAYPDGGVHPEDTFLVGDDLLVAAVEEAGATEKAVSLPPGGWVHWWSGVRYEGDVTVPAPLGEGPLFQREGSAIPLLRPEIMTLASTDGSVESWADAPGALHARVVPGDGAGFTLSDGEALAWADDTLVLTDGARYSGWSVAVWASDVTGVTLDGAALSEGEAGCSACWSTDGPWVTVNVPAGGVVGLVRG